jgi:hypothetical protein
MTRSIRKSMMAGLATVACVLTLAACGGSSSPPGSSQGTQTTGTSPPPGQADSRICQVVTQATAAYNAKDFTTWRSDMILIGDSADSAQYIPIRNYAEEIKQATSSTTTTTTKPKSKSHRHNGYHFQSLFNELGAYGGLQRACASLPTQ